MLHHMAQYWPVALSYLHQCQLLTARLHLGCWMHLSLYMNVICEITCLCVPPKTCSTPVEIREASAQACVCAQYSPVRFECFLANTHLLAERLHAFVCLCKHAFVRTGMPRWRDKANRWERRGHTRSFEALRPRKQKCDNTCIRNLPIYVLHAPLSRCLLMPYVHPYSSILLRTIVKSHMIKWQYGSHPLHEYLPKLTTVQIEACCVRRLALCA